MIVSLTGTPGTGKSSVAEELEDDFRVIDLTGFARKKGTGVEGEEFKVNLREMEGELDEEIGRGEDALIEGHLAHHYPADYCVVLRCSPDRLRERLEQRDYSREKVEENIEAEKLDSVLIEAVERQEKIIEVDTTGSSSGKVASEIRRRIRNDDTGYGEIDWSETI